MASRSQIVPSKNALRALRKLALGGSTVVGAVGSVSVLGCVSYDIQQRIHLAESIVETKRVLHSQSVSNPNRKAHMATIFEMYENGQGKEGHESWQDFSRRARRHSAKANRNKSRGRVDIVVKEEAISLVDIADDPSSLKSSREALRNSLDRPIVSPKLPNPPWERTRIAPKENSSSQSDQNSLIAKRIIEATQKPHKVDSHTVYGRPQESHNTTPVQRIITATQRQHKLTSHAVFGRPSKTKEENLPKIASCVQQWLSPGEITRGVKPLTSLKRPSAPRTVLRSYDDIRQYSTLTAEEHDGFDDPAMWRSALAGRYDDYFFPKGDIGLDRGQRDRVLDLITLGPPQETDVHVALEGSKSREAPSSQLEKEGEVMSTIARDVQDNIFKLMNSAMGKLKANVKEVHDISAFSESAESPVSMSRDISPRGATGSVRISNKYMDDTTSKADGKPSPVLKQLVTVIHSIRRKSGIAAAQELVIDALHVYARGGRAVDFRAMDQLFLHFETRLKIPRCPQLTHPLIHYLLNTGLDDDRRRAGRLLFRHQINDVTIGDHASSVIRYQYDQEAPVYIDWLCSTNINNSSVLQQFRKVLAATYERGATPSEALFYPVLSRLMERGDLKQLRNMFDEMRVAYGVDASPLTETILLLAYAKANDWNRITTEFERMHRDGTSRKAPIGYAMMFNEVFREYAASEPVEKTHDFLVNAICYWGLIPVTEISATAVQAYIRHRRYDLIKEWMEAARHMFPNVDNGGNRFTFSVAKTWSEIGASCEEIEEACLSIMRGANNIIPGRFRAVVQEALAGHLARKLDAADLDSGASKDRSNQAQDAHGLYAQLEAAFAVILEHTRGSGVVRQSDVADLLAQSSAALRLRKLFGARNSIAAPDVEIAPRLDRPSKNQASPSKSLSKDLATPIPDILRREQLPDRMTVMSLVSSHYSQRLKLGERISHDILKTTCRQLDLMRRYYDIVTILSATYNGPPVQGPDGVMFDIDIMQAWMEAACQLKSVSACKQILIAMLEKGTEIRLTEQFMLLVRMAASKAFSTKFSGARRHLASKIAELNHLENRLRDRFYAQRKMTGAKKGREHRGLLDSSVGKPGEVRWLESRKIYS